MLLPAMRCFFRSAAHGCSGRPPATPAPMSKKRPGPDVSTPVAAATSGRVPGEPPVPLTSLLTCWSSRHPMFSHTPERSGTPAAVRGTGPCMFTRPSAARGAAAARRWGHCADSGTDAASSPATSATERRFLIEA
jgi:hypothetical protein